jgi:hypothetical protein
VRFGFDRCCTRILAGRGLVLVPRPDHLACAGGGFPLRASGKLVVEEEKGFWLAIES